MTLCKIVTICNQGSFGDCGKVQANEKLGGKNSRELQKSSKNCGKVYKAQKVAGFAEIYY
jgi:hypothetical protein